MSTSVPRGRDGRFGRLAFRGLILASVAAGLLVAMALADPQAAVLYAAYAGLGAYLVIRRPRNSIGWLLMLIGWGLALGSARVVPPLLSDPGARQGAAIWANGCAWSLAFIGFLTISLVFPTGVLPRGRGRWPSVLLLGAGVGLATLIALGPVVSVSLAGSGTAATVPNPVAVAPAAWFWTMVPDPVVLYVMMFSVLLAGLVALVRRYLRSTGIDHLQYRWLVTAIVLVALGTLAWALVTYVLPVPRTDFAYLIVLVTYPSVPIAITFAILRYRLYDIDRIISRGIAYGMVITLLAGVFGLGIVLLSSAFASVAAGQSIAVAGATLLVCSIAQPVLRRIRSVVDRRFDRARYDAERITVSFSSRLRDETDVGAVTDDLVATTHSTVAPTSSSVWLRPVVTMTSR